jgi:hypothetical protein
LRCIFILLLACFSAPLYAQITEPAPQPLLDAGHCLASADRDWLDVARENPYQLELGYVSPDESASGQDDALYLIDFTSPTHTEGFAFTFLTQGKGSHRVLSLQSRTRFRQTDDGSQQVNLVNPPLGGIGSQDEILAAIRQVGFHTWRVPVADLRNRSSAVRCDTSQGVM